MSWYPRTTWLANFELTLFALLNAMLVWLFSLLHRFEPAPSWPDLYSQLDHVIWSAVQSILILLPALCVGLTLSSLRVRVACRVSVALTVATTVVYFTDLAWLVSIHEHFLTPLTWRLLSSVWPFISEYISVWHYLWLAIAVALLLACQRLFWWLASRAGDRVCRRWNQSTSWFWSVFVVVLPVVVVTLPILFSLILINWPYRIRSFAAVAGRHPITCCGMFSANQTPRLDRGSRAAELGQQWIREHQDFRRRFVAEQRTAADHEQVKSPLSDPPDVLVVIVECLRDDALSPLTAPHLMHWSRRGLRLRQHYSTGNASNLGFFGIMFGLDAIWFGDADELPIRMCAGLRQYGYQTGFFRP